MKKRLVAVASAVALMCSAVAGVAAADESQLFVEINQPANQATVAAGQPVDVAGKVGAGAGDGANVVFVVDGSGSTEAEVGGKSVFEHEQQGGKALLKSLQSKDRSINMGVVYFSEVPHPYGLTTDMAKIDAWLSERHPVSSLGTNCGWALQGAHELLKDAQGHKRIYFLTDGKCNGPEEMLNDGLQRIKDAGIELHTIHTTTESEQCKSDVLKGETCVYAEDPSTLQAKLPASVRPVVDSLTLVVTDAQGTVVEKQDLSDKVGTAIIDDWTTKLGALTKGEYTVTVRATTEDGAKAEQCITITVGDVPAPKPAPSQPEPADPEPAEPTPAEPKPEPAESTPAPAQPTEDRPGLPRTGC